MTVFMKFDGGSILQEESQRDSGAKPRVARHELPWEVTPNDLSTPTGLRLICLRLRVCHRHNPVGVAIRSNGFPRVARSSQPWAGGRNPFGIGQRSRVSPRSLLCGHSSFAFGSFNCLVHLFSPLLLQIAMDWSRGLCTWT